MCTSLQNIVSTEDHRRMERDIELLFKPKPYPRFQLQQFYKHKLYEHNEHFNFFLDILEEWNRKIQKDQMPSHSDTFFHKNAFIFNSLRNSIMQPLDRSQKILSHLYNWFADARKNCKPVERKIKPFAGHDEAWLIRNTFKSNLPAEIGLYRRRVCCRNPHTQKMEQLQTTICSNDENKGRKIKTQNWVYEEGKELEKKKITQIENDVIRFQREAQQLNQVQKKWKVKKAREHQGGIKNFYRGKFSKCKTYFARKEKQNNRDSQIKSVKKLHTSLGARLRNSKDSNEPKKQLRHSLGGQKSALLPKRHSSKQLTTFQQFEEVRLSDITGMRLLNNPQEVKLKKKKRAK